MDVIALAILCTTLAGPPQDVGTPVRRSVTLAQDPNKAEARRRASDFEDPGSSELPRIDAVPTPLAVASSLTGPRPSGLDAVYEAVGLPADLRELGGVIVRMQLVLFDGSRVLADLELLHFADFASPGHRDRLEFMGMPGMGRVYGRDSGLVFAERSGIPWQQLEQDAAEELEVFGALLRFPWVFGNEEFLVGSSEAVTVKRKPKTRIRAQRRQMETDSADRFEVICDPLTLVPEAVHMIRGGTSARVEVQLSDYATYGGISVPRTRTFLGVDGQKVMEIRIIGLEVKQDLPPSLFRIER